MIEPHQTDHVLLRLIAWARHQPAVRAVLLTGSRANPRATIDVLSDYDVVLVVEDIHPFFDDRSWLESLGRVLVAYWDPIHPAPASGIEQTGNVLLFEDGLKIDFSLWPVASMRQVAAAATLPAALDTGYETLVDKDNLTKGINAPSYTAYLLHPPAEDIYQRTIQDFFSDAPYVAKCLWRDELLPAKWCLDYDMKHIFLRQMLEWRMEIDHDWAVSPGVLGQGLKRRLPPDLWSQLEHTYVGAGIEENWQALFRTMALFRRVAIEVADRLGYVYPLDVDEGVVAYVQQVRLTPVSEPLR